MDIHDLEKEIEKIRVRNHDFANILMVHKSQQRTTEELMDEVRNELKAIHLTLSGGLEKKGLVNKVEDLEDFQKSTKYWIKAIVATILTILGKFSYSEFFSPMIKSNNTNEVVMVKPDSKLELRTETDGK